MEIWLGFPYPPTITKFLCLYFQSHKIFLNVPKNSEKNVKKIKKGKDLQPGIYFDTRSVMASNGFFFEVLWGWKSHLIGKKCHAFFRLGCHY